MPSAALDNISNLDLVAVCFLDRVQKHVYQFKSNSRLQSFVLLFCIWIIVKSVFQIMKLKVMKIKMKAH